MWHDVMLGHKRLRTDQQRRFKYTVPKYVYDYEYNYIKSKYKHKEKYINCQHELQY